MALAAVAFGIAIGFAVGAIGGGGSVLAVPVLVYVLGEDVEHATTASLVIVTAGSVAGGVGHARAGRVCARHALAFVTAAAPAIVAGTVVGGAIGTAALIVGFALVMLVAAAGMWQRAAEDEDLGDEEPDCPPLRLAPVLGAGLAIGFMTGLFGVGGGFLIVPALSILLGFAMRSAVGTSLAIMTVTSAIGLAAHLGAGRELDLGLTLAMAAGCALGAVGGTAVAGRMPQPALARAFALLVVAIAAYLLTSSTLGGGPPGAS